MFVQDSARVRVCVCVCVHNNGQTVYVQECVVVKRHPPVPKGTCCCYGDKLQVQALPVLLVSGHY